MCQVSLSRQDGEQPLESCELLKTSQCWETGILISWSGLTLMNTLDVQLRVQKSQALGVGLL